MANHDPTDLHDLAPAERDRGSRVRASIGLVVIAAVALLAVVIINATRDGVAAPLDSPSSSPPSMTSPSNEPDESVGAAIASPTPIASATAAPEAIATDLAWSETGSFGSPNGQGLVRDLIVAGDRLIAVGVTFESKLPNLGPSPLHQGRIWESTDGQTWSDITPVGMFANTDLRKVLDLGDGSIVVLGTRAQANAVGQLDSYAAGTWGSADGRNWAEVDLGLPPGSYLVAAVDGARGHLAHVVPAGATHGSELWFSADGRSWEHVRSFTDGLVSIGAGEEGFVAAGSLGYYGTPSEPFAIASGDGREWHESSSPPSGGGSVVARGPDWIAFTRDANAGLDAAADVWSSANGLDWHMIGSVEAASVSPDGVTSCYEQPTAILGAGRWLIQSSTLTYPCGEGGFFVNGSVRLSLDGIAWEQVPLPEETVGASGSGSGISAAVEFDGRLVIAGNSNGRATFWVGETP